MRRRWFVICVVLSFTAWTAVSYVRPVALGDSPPGPSVLELAQEIILGPPSDYRTNPDTEDISHVAVSEPSPGVDLCLALSWEPTIAVDPNNPMIIVAAQSRTIKISLDGGDDMFMDHPTITAPLPPGNS